jgi:predicted transcriptional regulator
MCERNPEESPRIADVKATSVRLDDAMMDAVKARAEALDTNPSEFIRSAVAFRLGWLAAMEAVAADPNPAALARAALEAERDQRPPR